MKNVYATIFQPWIYTCQSRHERIFMNKNYYGQINYTIQTLLKKFEKGKVDIAIYPYGYVGQYVKEILNNVYGIQETYIFDKNLSRYNEKIHWFDNVSKEKLEKAAVIITCENIEFYDEVRNICKTYFHEENMFDVFPKVCMRRDVRIETLRLNAEYIKQLNVKGSVAELGVYNGDFSKEINKYFGDRTLYLFDTFEGFYHEQVKAQVDDRFMAELEISTNYCVVDDYKTILRKFKYPEKCVIKKGFFPDTADGVDDTFCFVSIDVDIYSSTKAGLEFFWPKMEENGIIMVHDYNCNGILGVKEAVDEFAKNHHARLVMLSDHCGSVVMVK